MELGIYSRATKRFSLEFVDRMELKRSKYFTFLDA